MLLGSVFGIFFSGEDSGTGMSMQTVVQEINTEYDTKLQDEKNLVSYDVLEMNGSRAVWKEVLAVYSVKVNTDPDNPQEVATMDESKKQLLTDIFWEMNEISSSTDTKTETVITETDDGMIINGGKSIHGADFKTYGDHRMAMSLTVLAQLADGESTLDDSDCACVSYPTFFDDFYKLGE